MKRNNTDAFKMIAFAIVVFILVQFSSVQSDRMVNINILFDLHFVIIIWSGNWFWFCFLHFIHSTFSWFLFEHLFYWLKLEMADKQGIEMECHYVTTKDGYILRLYHMLPSANMTTANNRTAFKPMLFMHGLQSSSLDFVFYPNSSVGKRYFFFFFISILFRFWFFLFVSFYKHTTHS